jgi:hypothetical protein
VILLLAIIAGLVAGNLRAIINGQQFCAPDFRLGWLLLIAVIPQLFAFHIPGTSDNVPDQTAVVILVSSQTLLLIFVWANRHLPGFWALGTGLVLNLLVIMLNGGLMPISPETVERMIPEATLQPDLIGVRLGSSKDVLLPVFNTNLWWLSDLFVIPWISYKVAFSLGDVLISIGVFWLFWSHGNIDEVQARYIRST